MCRSGPPILEGHRERDWGKASGHTGPSRGSRRGNGPASFESPKSSGCSRHGVSTRRSSKAFLGRGRAPRRKCDGRFNRKPGVRGGLGIGLRDGNCAIGSGQPVDAGYPESSPGEAVWRRITAKAAIGPGPARIRRWRSWGIGSAAGRSHRSRKGVLGSESL
jgi:hypothetical protein